MRNALLIVLLLVLVSGGFYWLGSKNRSSDGIETPNPSEATSSEGSTNDAPSSTSGSATVPSATQGSNATIAPSSPSAVSGKNAPEFVRPGGFTNADPFTLQSLRGQRIVLLEFWTTSSIDAAHTMPYLSDWDGKYRNFGLTVIGVHTPRFTFERSKTVVDEYAKAHNMSFPLVIDNNAETWKAYKNSVWPHLYLIDLSGRIVYEHAGDGAYALTEQKLLDLLNARAKQLKLPAPPDQKLTKLPPDDTDPSQVKKHETFFGASRNTDLANGTAGKEGVQTFDSLSEPKLGSLYLFGGWKISREYAENLSEHTSILYRYHAKHVYSIMGSVKMVRVKVLVDGKPLSEKDAGKDVRFEKGESVFYVTHERLYDIVNSSAGYADRTIELIPETGGLDVYTLTFD